MADYSNIPLGLKITTQIPLDVKSYVTNEATLKDLGSGNNLAFTYCKGAIFYCVEEGTRYQWREVVGSEVGLMSSHYTYPANVVAFGITYSNKVYNFFPILITGQLNSDWNSESGVTKILNKPTIPSITGLATVTYVDAQDALKVDKVSGSRLITSAESIVLGNTSGTNTGNNAVNTLYSGLEASKQDKLTLTSNNTSGAATLIGGVLNIPQYSNSQTLQAVTSSGNTTNIPIKFINNDSTILKAVLGDNTKGLFIEMDNNATGIDILNNDAVGTIPFIYRKYNPSTEVYATLIDIDNDGNISSESFIKNGGLPTQYLMADGSTSLAANKENSANKQNSLVVDGTGVKFPTVDAVNAGISTITTQLAGKMNNPSLTANYIPKALTATTIGNSRIVDTDTYLGIGTVNTPVKDITLGRQSDRFIGIEQSDSNLVGRSLNVSAGRTINYSESATFISTGQSSFGIEAMALAADGKIVALGHEGQYYEKPVGTNIFTYVTYLSNSFYLSGASMAFNLIGDLYIIAGGNLKKRAGNTGSTFVNTTMNGSRLAIDGNDIYVTVDGVDVFKQTNSVGPFVALGTTPQTSYLAIVVNPTTKDIYVSNSNNISKITGGTGPNTLHRTGYVGSMYLSKTNDFYINALGTVYRQSNFSGAYTNVGTSNTAFGGAFCENNLGDIFLSGSSDGFMRYLQLYAVGSPNLNGGTLSLNAGTGKGTGASDIEMWTGQVKPSGTDMQDITLRAKIDNTGLMTLPSVTNALIEADTTGKAVVTKEYVNNRLVVETASPYTLTDADSGGIIIFTSSTTLTIPTGLANGFECTFVTLTGATLTVSSGSNVLNNATGTTMAAGLSFTLKRMLTANTFIATGNL